MKNLFYHHLGLGDHIVHNGMIRYIYSKLDSDDELYIFSKEHNLKNVKYMFRDIDRLKVIPVKDDGDAMYIYNSFEGVKFNNMLSQEDHIKYNTLCDDIFYLKMGIDPDVKKTFFHIERDLDLENKCFNELVHSKDYIFIHEDDERGFLIDRSRITNNLPIVKSDVKYGFFDLLKVIENAKEVHLISSSFLSLLTCKKYNDNIYAHMYLRYSSLSEYIRKNNIIIYE